MEASARGERRWGDRTAEQRRAERRTQIIRAAVRVYGEKGYRNATVKAVCDAAGLTERYFYESFANSEELLCQCFREVTHKLLSRMRTAAREHGGAPVECVRAALLVYLNQLRDDPSGARVFLFEMASISSATEALASASLDEFGAHLIDLLRADSAFEDQVSSLMLRGVVGGGLHIAQAWIAGGYAEPVDAVANDALRLYMLVAAR